MTTTSKVAIYVRVSTTNQAEEGYSIDEQKDKLTSYCDIMGWNVYNVYTDAGFSGSNTERPAIIKLIKDAQHKKFDTVLVYKLDRLSRSQKDTLHLIEDVFLENGIDFVSLLEKFDTSTPFGKAMVGILSVFAQLEREQIKERMQLGKIGRAKSGKAMMWARVAYGYDYDQSTGELTVNEAQAIVIREIFADYLSGMTIRKIKDKLNEKYPKTPNWSYRAIRIIIENPVYCGKIRYNNVIYQGNHEPIVPEKDFDAAQEEIKERQIKAYKKTGQSRPFQGKYMLAGIAQCGYCLSPLRVTLGKIRKDGTRPRYYSCYQRFPRKKIAAVVYNDNRKCDSGSYRMEDIENYVINEILKMQRNAEYLDSIFDSPSKEIDREAIKKQIDSLENKISRLNDLYIDDRLTLDELKKKSSEFLQMKNTLESELESDTNSQKKDKKKKVQELLAKGDIRKRDYEQQKMIVNILISKVQVTSDGINILWNV